jgi:glutamyl-tRNA synthetase
LVEQFSLSEVNKAAAIFNPEKLLWLNAHYLRTLPSERLIEELLPHLLREGIVKSPEEADHTYLSRAIDSVRERSKTLVDMARGVRFYFTEHIVYDTKATAKFLTTDTAALLGKLISGLETLPTFDETAIERVFQHLMAADGVPLGAIAQPARVALTGGTVSPGIHEVMAILGRERVLGRLRHALDGIAGRTTPAS